tara:strand:- start:13557 stop:14057 length:501 start_codon:yes stop_codon:yes gene_type:complete
LSELFSEANLRLVGRTLLRLGATQEDVEDLAQEVFVIVHRKANDFDRSRRVEPWLYGIARNVMRDYWRKKQSRKERLGTDQDNAEKEHLGDLDRSVEQVAVLRQAIQTLEEPLIDVLMLKDLMGLTLIETASELEIPVDTAKDRLRRARNNVRAHVEQLEMEVASV